jgi:drug/metabolite transporter (DMT)-like permease
MPVWTAIFVVIAGVEAIPNVCELKGLMKVFGVLCAAGGAATMLLSKGKASEYPKPLLGAMFSLINTVLFALYITIQKLAIFSPKGSCHAKWNSTPLYVTAWSYGFGAVFMVLGGLGGCVLPCHLCCIIRQGCAVGRPLGESVS